MLEVLMIGILKHWISAKRWKHSIINTTSIVISRVLETQASLTIYKQTVFLKTIKMWKNMKRQKFKYTFNEQYCKNAERCDKAQ